MKRGSHFTDEQRANLSLAGEQRRGIPKSDITRARISAARMGIKFSDETKAKLSAARTGKAHPHRGHLASPETRAKQSAASRGRTHKGYVPSDEQKRKQSVMMMGNKYSLGFHPSEETKAKQSKAGWEGGPSMSWRRHDAKRRLLGWNPLNSWFEGSEGHHLNQIPGDVIYIPEAVHDSVKHNIWTGKNMEEINALARNWLTKENVRVEVLYIPKEGL